MRATHETRSTVRTAPAFFQFSLKHKHDTSVIGTSLFSPDRTTGVRALGSWPFAIHRLPIRRVILYSNGVAYIERRGMVSNHAEVAMSFKQSQVDDVLKSMVVLDLGKGRIGAVSYNSSAPPSVRLAEIPLPISSRRQKATMAASPGY